MRLTSRINVVGGNMFKEFKEFIKRGNMLDLAVGVIIGAAISKVVTSLVQDIIMPFAGALLGGIKFDSLSWKITEELSVNYGLFIQSVIDFIIIAVCVFFMIKLFNTIRKKTRDEVIEPVKISMEEQLLTEIRDLLKEQSK